MARKTKQEAQQTRLALLKAGLALFDEKGVANTTLNDIAKSAGMTRGAIYWHFENKLEMLRAMFEEFGGEIEQEMYRMAADTAHSPLTRVRKIADYMANILSQEQDFGHLIRILYQACESRGEFAELLDDNRQDFRDLMTMMNALFVEASELGEIGQRDPRVMAMGSYCMLNGIMETWSAQVDDFDIVEQTRAVMDDFLAPKI